MQTIHAHFGWLRRGATRLLLIAACAGFGLLILGLIPEPATAYTHNQPCFNAPYSQCYDTRGQNPNPWFSVVTQMANLQNAPGVCAKAMTPAPASNIKSGSTCATNTSQVTAFLQPTPQSIAYGYWGDNGCACSAARNFTVSATT